MNPAHAEELDFLVAKLRDCDIRSVLEIGVRNGISLVKWASVMPQRSLMVGVDMPNALWGSDSRRASDKVAEQIGAYYGHDVQMIYADSHAAETVGTVRKLLPEGGLFDFCYIDADHTYEGVRQDWLNYAPMCRVVAFDDIASPSKRQDENGVWQEAGVSRLWAEIKAGNETDEFISVAAGPHHPPQGTGIVFRTSGEFSL